MGGGVNGATRREKERSEGVGRSTRRAVGGGRRRQHRFVMHGGTREHTVSGGPAVGPTRGEGKWVGRRGIVIFLFIQRIFK
jgi:hypothetical protein